MQISANNRVFSVRIDSSITNIPTTYDATANSLVISSLGGLGFYHIKILNETTSRIALCNTDADSGVPDSDPITNPHQMYVSDEMAEWRDGQHLYSHLYIRSDTGSTITDGVLVIEVWG